MNLLRTLAWIVGIAALLGWSQVILGVAVFAIPDRYEAPESVAFSLVALAIGIAVPAAVVWALLAHGVLRPSRPVRVITLAARGRTPELEYDGRPRLPAEPERLAEPLTEREIEVLQLVAAGKSNKEIAQELVISVGTVKTHTNNAYRKLSARNRIEAVAAAQQRRLI